MKTLDSTLNYSSLTPSCSFVETRDGGVLFGCISESVKYLSQAGLGSVRLRAIVLSDSTQVHGVANWAFEFPIYKHLFVDGGMAEGRRLAIVGTKRQLERARKVIEVTLLGPSKQQFKSWSRKYPGSEGRFKMLQQAAASFAIKRADGSAMALEDMVEFLPYGLDRSVNLGSTRVEHRSTDQFEIEDTGTGHGLQVSLDFEPIPVPPFSLASLKKRPALSPQFGVSVLLNGNGFDPRGGCTAMIVWVDGKPLLWDSGPFATQCLQTYGLRVRDLAGVIITHVHDDHASVVELLSSGDRIRLYATPEVYESILIKYAAVLDRDLEDTVEREELEHFLEFVPLEVGRGTEFGPVRFTPHYTLHSIPTIGGRFEIGDRGDERSILVTGDHASPRRVRALHESGVLPEAWMKSLGNLIRGDETLVICDGGADDAGVHGDPAEPELRNLSLAMGERLQFCHRSDPILADGRTIPLAEAGSEFVLIEGKERHEDVSALALAFEIFGMADAEALAGLWAQSEVVERLADDFICRKGDVADYVYVISSGQVAVEGIDTTNPIILTRGCICGEMGTLTGALRNASLRSVSATRLIRIEGAVFKDFVLANNLMERFEKLWSHRQVVISVRGFRDLPLEIIHIVTRNLRPIEVPSGEEIISEGDYSDEAYMVASGTLKVNREGHTVATLREGDLFGEKAALTGGTSARTATVRAQTDAALLRFDGSVIRELNRRYFVVNHILRLLLRERNLIKG